MATVIQVKCKQTLYIWIVFLFSTIHLTYVIERDWYFPDHFTSSIFTYHIFAIHTECYCLVSTWHSTTKHRASNDTISMYYTHKKHLSLKLQFQIFVSVFSSFWLQLCCCCSVPAYQLLLEKWRQWKKLWCCVLYYNCYDHIDIRRLKIEVESNPIDSLVLKTFSENAINEWNPELDISFVGMKIIYIFCWFQLQYNIE